MCDYSRVQGLSLSELVVVKVLTCTILVRIQNDELSLAHDGEEAQDLATFPGVAL